MNTNLMQQSPAKPPLRKQHVALLLGCLALLSWAYSTMVDHSVRKQADIAEIPMATAAEEKTAQCLLRTCASSEE